MTGPLLIAFLLGTFTGVFGLMALDHVMDRKAGK